MLVGPCLLQDLVDDALPECPLQLCLAFLLELGLLSLISLSYFEQSGFAVRFYDLWLDVADVFMVFDLPQFLEIDFHSLIRSIRL